MTDEPRPESRPVGRPTDYTIEKAADICARLASGEPLVRICRDEGMPHVATVYRWIEAHDEFRDMYTRAREDQADTLADEIVEISDDGRNDWMIRAATEEGKESGLVLNAEHIQRSRLRVDARKWIAAKLKPKKYGERITQELTGPNGGPILHKSADDLTDDELAAIAARGRAAPAEPQESSD